MLRAPLKTEPHRSPASLVAHGFLGLLMLAQVALVWQVVAQTRHAPLTHPAAPADSPPPLIAPLLTTAPPAAPVDLSLPSSYATLPPPAPGAPPYVAASPLPYAGNYPLAPVAPPPVMNLPPPGTVLNVPSQPMAPTPYLPPVQDHFGNDSLREPSLSNLPPAQNPESPAPRPTLPPGRQIKDPQVAQAVAAARDVRKKGDMLNALEAFKQADLHERENPEILSEIAITYEMLDLKNKAESYWHRVVAMGEDVAGGYYVLAKDRLTKGAYSSEGAAPPDGGAIAGEAPVALGSCEAAQDPSYIQGEKVTLRIPIKARPGQSINAQGINVRVFFFNQLTNGSVEISKEEPPYRWLSTKWSSPEGGVLQADSVIPTQSPAYSQAHGGMRRYYGWMVKLYYENKLVGQQASSDDLLNVGPQGSGAAGADNALFPRN